MSPLFGADFPVPSPEEVTLYLLGPGIGESVVAIMPDMRAMVVDVCVSGSMNLTLELLNKLGIKTPDLLVVSHPDLDHVRGLDTLLAKTPPKELWRYPLEPRARDFALAWAKKRKKTPLANALEALGQFLRTEDSETFPAMYGDRVWPHDATSYRVHALAPTPYDLDLAVRAWDRRLARGPAALDKWLDEVATGKRALGDAPNLVSLALLIEHGSRRVLLGGDVLCGARSPKSGWKGIERLMKKHDRVHLVQALAAVKVAHHGSDGAFEPIVWKHHFQNAAVGEPIAFLAPFSPSNLPAQSMLTALRPYARALLITEAGMAGDAKLAGTGWSCAAAGHIGRLTETEAPCVAIQIGVPGSVRINVSIGGLAAA
jgi:Metallo-beta-lactamase superfamily